jgi:hypothetical protein
LVALTLGGRTEKCWHRRAAAWLRMQKGQGLIIAAKVFVGLYFANERSVA